MVWRHCSFYVVLKLLAATKLLGRVVHNLPDHFCDLCFEVIQLLVLKHAFSQPHLSDAACNLAVLLGSLTELLPLGWVVSRHQVGCGLLREDILD